MKLSKKIKKGSKVKVLDLVRFRFTNGAFHAGENGKVTRVIENQSAIYIEFKDDSIGIYDIREVSVKWNMRVKDVLIII